MGIPEGRYSHRGPCLSRMNNGEGNFVLRADGLSGMHPESIIYIQRFCDEQGNPARHPGLPEFPESLIQTISFEEEEDGMTVSP